VSREIGTPGVISASVRAEVSAGKATACIRGSRG
jgi:hypothetical protein